MELNTTRLQLYNFEDLVNSGSLGQDRLDYIPIDFTRSQSKEVVVLTMYWTLL